MNRSRARTRSLVLLGFLAMVAIGGCGGGDSQPEAVPGSIDTSSAATGSQGPPPDTGGDDTSVNLPSAPVGGQSEAPGDDPAFQCLSVNWLAGDDATIPDGGSVALGGDFSFDPAVLDVVGSGCEDQGPTCDGFSFTASDLSCSQALQWNGTEFSSDIGQASADVSATATCDDGSDECAAFLEAVMNQSPSQLSVTLPSLDEESTDDDVTDDSETSSSG